MADDLKQVILLRKDLKMTSGKAASQAAHASVNAVINADDETVEAWLRQGGTKVVVAVHSFDEMQKYYLIAKDMGLAVGYIRDAGITPQVEPGTYTAAAIGPDLKNKINVVTGKLELY